MFAVFHATLGFFTTDGYDHVMMSRDTFTQEIASARMYLTRKQAEARITILVAAFGTCDKFSIVQVAR